MNFYDVGVTSLTARVHPEELTAAARALQIQVVRDFFPEWGVSAIVAATPFSALPAGTIPIIVRDDLTDTRAHGFHRVRRDDSPYIVVPYGPNWTLAASQELLRMLANPTGSARVAGRSRMRGQGTVEYFLDVCGPCQGIDAAYAIDGVAVADFCTKGFYGGGGTAASFAGGVRATFEPGADGVVTWLADDGLLYQARGDEMGLVHLHGGFSPANRGGMMLRELVDGLTPDRLVQLSNAPRTARLVEATVNARRTHFANMSRFNEDMAWRFGVMREPVGVVKPIRVARRPDGGGDVPMVRETKRVVGDPALTARSPS
jgi:hypothetical protein